jgi:hypothetical protein
MIFTKKSKTTLALALGVLVSFSILGFGQNGIASPLATTNGSTSGAINGATTTANFTAPEAHLSRWTMEANAQAQSVAGAGSPWLGIAGAYQFFEALSLGVRGFVPLSHTVDTSTYSLQGYARLRAIRGLQTDFIIEPDFAVNFYSFAPRMSYGVAIGALNRFSPGLSVGILGGVEFAHYVLDSVGLEERSDLIVYPKVSLVADFNF